MSDIVRVVAWIAAAVIILVVISFFVGFLLRIALFLALLALGYYLFARARHLLNRNRR